MKKLVKESLNESADWIILQSANVALDTESLNFMPLNDDGTINYSVEIEPDEEKYEEIYNKLDNKDLYIIQSFYPSDEDADNNY